MKGKMFLILTIIISFIINSLFFATSEGEYDVDSISVSIPTVCDYSKIVAEISDKEYRAKADISDESFVVVRKEDKGDNSLSLDNEIAGCEIVSVCENADGSRLVTYSVKSDSNSDIWNEIDFWNSSGDCLIAEPVYEYHICDDDDSDDTHNIENNNTDNNSTEEALLSNAGISEQWYLKEQGLLDFWNNNGINEYSGKGSVVAVIDTGVDYDHEDLKDNIWINEAEANGKAGVDDDGNGYVDDIHGVSVVDGDDGLMDDNGHGTFVAGVIGMENNDVGGVGMACNSRLMIVKAGDASGTFKSTDIAKAIDYASAMGADVINMSFGAYVHSAIVETALGRAFGSSVLVAAAGNESYSTADSDSEKKGNQYPACYPYVIGVMAYDKEGKLASFSNLDTKKGEGPEYELAAPGSSIYSTTSGGGYGAKNGTSYSAPIVSAAAAVYIADMKGKTSYSSRGIMNKMLENLQADENGLVKFSSGAFLESVKVKVDDPTRDDGNTEGVVDNETSDNYSAESDTDTTSPTVLNGTITEDTTFDGNYIIDGEVIIDEGVTVTVVGGSRIEFWTGDPATVKKTDPYTYIKVNGSFICDGSQDNPINLLPGRDFTAYEVKIVNNGTVNMSYVNITNPCISINNGDHLNLVQDFDTVNYRGIDNKGKYHVYKGGSSVICDNISFSNMSNLRCENGNGNTSKNDVNIEGNFDTVQFDNCSFNACKVSATNSVFLINCARVDSSDNGSLVYKPMIINSENIVNEHSNNVILNNSHTSDSDLTYGNASESCYPIVSDVYVEDKNGERASVLVAGEYKLHIAFNRDMCGDIGPEVSYDINDPFTNHIVSGSFVNSKEWVGDIIIDDNSNEELMYVRVKGACAATDKWLVTGTDWGRYSFEVKLVVDTPSDNPSDSPGDEPTDTPSDNPSDTPETEPGDTPGEEMGEKPSEKQEVEPGDTPSDTPEIETGDTPGEESVETPNDKQKVEPGDTPSDTPGDEPGDTPSDTPGEESVETPNDKQEVEPSDTLSETPEVESGNTPTDKTSNTLGVEPKDTQSDKTEIKPSGDLVVRQDTSVADSGDKSEQTPDDNTGENSVENSSTVGTSDNSISFIGFNMTMKKNALKLKWNKIKGADGYYVYAGCYGSKMEKPAQIINKNNKRSIKITKLNGKKIKRNKVFAAKIEAFKIIDGKKTVIAKSDICYLAGDKNKKYTNAKAISLAKKYIKLNVGETEKISATTIPIDNKKKQLTFLNVKKFRYVSLDESIVTVDKNGKLKGVAVGTTKVHVYARNGLSKTLSVTVK